MPAPTTGAMIAAVASEWAAVDTAKLYWDNTNTRLGIGITPLHQLHTQTVAHAVYGLCCVNAAPNVSVNATNYDIGIQIGFGSAGYDISSGVTDSGYRIGLDIGVHCYDASFLGTLTSQFGIRINYGDYTGGGAGTITTAYGIYLNYLDSGSATISTKYSIYSEGAARMYHAGRMSIGVDGDSYKFEIRGEGTTVSTYPIVVRNATPQSIFYMTDSGYCYIYGNCDADSYTGHCKYPDTLEQAYVAINSINRLGSKIDHSKLDPFLQGLEQMPGREDKGIDITALLTCMAEVMKDLIYKNKKSFADPEAWG